jgi:hypothetical protein
MKEYKIGGTCSKNAGDEKPIQNSILEMRKETELVRPNGIWKDNIKIGIRTLVGLCEADLYGTVWTSGVLWRICMAQCGQVACCGGFVWHSVDKWRVVADTTVEV